MPKPIKIEDDFHEELKIAQSIKKLPMGKIIEYTSRPIVRNWLSEKGHPLKDWKSEENENKKASE